MGDHRVVDRINTRNRGGDDVIKTNKKTYVGTARVLIAWCGSQKYTSATMQMIRHAEVQKRLAISSADFD